MSTTDIKISVIMPVYNVEAYLPKAIESMMNQTLKDIEIIIVDDGSPDGCGAIMDDYSRKDDRIIVIHKENGGAPSARNAGIRIARGKYMYFLDPDDWAEEGMLEAFYNMCEDNDSELLIAGFKMEYHENGKDFSIDVRPERHVYGSGEAFRKKAHEYLNNTLLAVPWNKLYRSDYLREHDLFFPDVAWDDLHFNMEVLKNIERVCVIDTPFYHFFRSRAGSETTKVFDGKLFYKRKEQFKHVLRLYKYWNLRDRNVYGELYSYYCNRLIQCIQEISGSDTISFEEKKFQIKTILNDSLTKKSIKYQKNRSTVMNICILPLKFQNVYLCIAMGKMITLFKGSSAVGFQKLKAKILRQN